MSETFVRINGAWHGGWAWRQAITGPGSHEACFTRPAELAASFLAA